MLANARELGVDLGVDVYKQTDRLEEEIIKKECKKQVFNQQF